MSVFISNIKKMNANMEMEREHLIDEDISSSMEDAGKETKDKLTTILTLPKFFEIPCVFRSMKNDIELMKLCFNIRQHGKSLPEKELINLKKQKYDLIKERLVLMGAIINNDKEKVIKIPFLSFGKKPKVDNMYVLRILNPYENIVEKWFLKKPKDEDKLI